MASTAPSSRGEFERQRAELLKEIAESFEHVLANINKLNRNLEAVITVGNEFSSVEALWSTFENVMGKDEHAAEGGAEGAEEAGHNAEMEKEGQVEEAQEEEEEEEQEEEQEL